MFSYLYGYSTPDFKKPISKKNGMEKIKISKNHPCDLISISEFDSHTLNLEYAYVRMDNRLVYLNKKNCTTTHIDIDEEQLRSFDKEFKPTSISRKLSEKELKKITLLTGHTQNVLYIELLHSGYYADQNRTLQLNHLLEHLSYPIEYHEIPSKPTWALFYTTYPDTTVQMTIPFTDIEKQRDEFIEIKNFIEKWDPQWFPILKKIADEILEEKTSFQLTKYENHIPILSSKYNNEHVFISFLYKGKGMDEERTKKIDELLKKINYKYEQYLLTDSGSAIQITIPIEEIRSGTERYSQLKGFVLVHDEIGLESILAYEDNFKSGEFSLSASQSF